MIVPVSGRNVRGFSAYRRASTAWPTGSSAPSPRALARRDPELLGDEVETGHRLRDRVLHLDAAVQLEEEEQLAVDDELDRPRARVADRTGEADCGLEQRGARLGMHVRSGGLLEHLLVAALHRAIPLPERDDGAVQVREHLHLDVARALEVALAVEGSVAEGGERLALGRLHRVLELAGMAYHAHATPAPARGGLDDEREADLGGVPSGRTGTSASRATRFASILSPPSRSAAAGGPTQVRPAATTASAKSPFSARKPYPGWTASAPVDLAARTCSSESR